MMIKKIKSKALILREHGSTYKIKKKKTINNTKENFIYKSKTFSPDFSNPTFSNGNKDYYLFDYESKKQIRTKKANTDNDATAKDLLYAKEVITQIVRSIEKSSFYITWLHLVLVLGVSLLGGWILGSYFPIEALG